jgi:hypothetical protein
MVNVARAGTSDIGSDESKTVTTLRRVLVLTQAVRAFGTKWRGSGQPPDAPLQGRVG